MAWWIEGKDHGFVWNHGVALVRGGLDAAAAGTLWQEMSDGGDLNTFLHKLSAMAQTDMLSLPEFSVAVQLSDGRWQVAARGSLMATVGQETVTSQGVTTWIERLLADADRVMVGEFDASADRRPLVAGLVPATAVGLTDPPAAELAAPPVAEPVDAPMPEGEPVPVDEPMSEDEPMAVDAPMPVVAPVPMMAPVSLPGGLYGTPDLSAPMTEAHDEAEELALASQPSHPASAEEVVDSADELQETPVSEESEDALIPPAEEPLASDPSMTLLPSMSDFGHPQEPGSQDEDANAGDEIDADDQADGLITSIAHAGLPTPVADPSASEVPPAPVLPSGGRFAGLYAETQIFSSEEAAIRGGGGQDDVAEPVPAADEVSVAGDHDGHTIMAAGPFVPPEAPVAEEPVAFDGPSVLGIRCPSGHENPPHRSTCAVCQEPLAGEPEQMPRPSLGVLRMPDGETIELTQNLLIGRAPSSARAADHSLPRLVPIPQSHISGNHLEIRLDGWNVMAVDLRSTNGTYLRRRGDAPVRLGDRPELLVDGDVLDLGHGVQLLLEHLR